GLPSHANTRARSASKGSPCSRCGLSSSGLVVEVFFGRLVLPRLLAPLHAGAVEAQVADHLAEADEQGGAGADAEEPAEDFVGALAILATFFRLYRRAPPRGA